MKTTPVMLAALAGAILGAFATQWWISLEPVARPVTAIPTILVKPATTTSLTGAEKLAIERTLRENTRLSAALAQSNIRLATSEEQLAKTQNRLSELSRPLSADLLSSTVNARLQPGETVVTGGYALADGRRLYAFVQPSLESVGGQTFVRVSGVLNVVTDEAGRAVGLDNLATNAANTLQHGEVWLGDEADAALTTLGASADAQIMTPPTVLARPGSPAYIRLEEPGLTLRVTPGQPSPSGDMDLEVRLEQSAQTDASADTAAANP